MNLACCQFDIRWENKAENYRQVAALVSDAKLPPQTLLLLPEMFATGFTMNSQAMAEPLDGPTAKFLAELAQRHQIFVQAGVIIAQENGKPRNEALIFDPAGKLLARYAKMHLFSYADEPNHYDAGPLPTVFNSGDAIVSPAICYDLRFPELFRYAIKNQAQILAVIACWPAAREMHWTTLLCARAIENQCYVAAVNRCGADPTGLTYGGRSMIVDPRGQVLAEAGNQPAVIQANVDLETLMQYRKEFTAIADMRSIS